MASSINGNVPMQYFLPIPVVLDGSLEERTELLLCLTDGTKIPSDTRKILEDLQVKEPSKERNTIITKALIGAYNDFGKSPYDAPLLALADDFKKAKCDDLYEKVSEGYYDSTFD